MDLFDHARGETEAQELPLAARMRPRNFDEFVGQEHVVGPGKVLRTSIERDQLPSIILWGPPGSGKTTLAQIIASVTRSFFVPLSGVTAGVTDIRKVVEEARERRKLHGQRTILFIDEIHRLNKAQQDALLPFVENGVVTLIGATTENPSFEVISPLLSRCRVFMLKGLSDAEVRLIVERALADAERGLARYNAQVDPQALEQLVVMANGDGRAALNAVELATLSAKPDASGKRKVNLAVVEDAYQHRALLYDRAGEEHYNIVSALHKSVRGSDPDAALYWLARMLEAGEDPLYLARRLVRMAAEDIGMADPQALVIAMAAQQAFHFVGLPEGTLALAEAAVYLATAPKSNSLEIAYGAVTEELRSGRNDPVPMHLRNPVTWLMKRSGYGKGYRYPHDFPGHFVKEQYLPDALKGRRFYYPGEQGFEGEVRRRLKDWWGGEKSAGPEAEKPAR